MPDSKTLLNDADPLLTNDSVLEDLRSLGLKCSKSWLEKLDKKGEGPPVECWWGKHKMRCRSKARAWAEKRLRKAAPVQSAPEPIQPVA